MSKVIYEFQDKKRLLEEKLASATAEFSSSLFEFTSLVDAFDDPRKRYRESDSFEVTIAVQLSILKICI